MPRLAMILTMGCIVALTGCRTTEDKEATASVRNQEIRDSDPLAAAVASLTSADASATAPLRQTPEPDAAMALASAAASMTPAPVPVTVPQAQPAGQPDLAALAAAHQAAAQQAAQQPVYQGPVSVPLAPGVVVQHPQVPSVANGILPPPPMPERQVVPISGPGSQTSLATMNQASATPVAPPPTVTYSGRTRPGRF